MLEKHFSSRGPT